MRVSVRDLDAEDFVYRITEPIFNADDKKGFGINWIFVPCDRGDIRITIPQLPYEVLGPAKGVRRILIP